MRRCGARSWRGLRSIGADEVEGGAVDGDLRGGELAGIDELREVGAGENEEAAPVGFEQLRLERRKIGCAALVADALPDRLDERLLVGEALGAAVAGRREDGAGKAREVVARITRADPPADDRLGERRGVGPARTRRLGRSEALRALER